MFATRTDLYLAGLTSYRDPEPQIDEWVIGFAQAAEQAAQTGVKLARDAAALDEQLLQRLVEHRRRQGTSPALPRRGAETFTVIEQDGSGRSAVNKTVTPTPSTLVGNGVRAASVCTVPAHSGDTV
ncbi:hypothetical protein [Nocardia carnea]|uniref:hypothetical protein n=1 Tax=Nocardia carnea TaxID=37328 RepID=UPI00245728C5|nr:hypothetical protein [Nocardia carnea]